MPKISIILPTLRTTNALDCIHSIEVNSYTNYEIIIVSSQDVITYLRGSNCNLSTIKFVTDFKQIGTTYAINLGLKVASGEYIVTLSDDSRPCPHWDDHMIKFLEAQPKDHIVLGNFRVFDSTGEMPAIGYYGRQFSMFPILSKENLDILGTYFSEDFNAFYSDPDLGMRVINLAILKRVKQVLFIILIILIYYI